MKLASFTPTGPNIVEAVIPRPNGQAIMFKCQAVLDYSDFDTLCPVPKPPVRVYSNGRQELDYDDAKYKEKSEKWGKFRLGFVLMRSLAATEGLEWEHAKLGDPETWLNIENEFRSLFMTDAEIRYVIECVMEANSLNEDKLDEARKSFLASRQVQQSQT